MKENLNIIFRAVKENPRSRINAIVEYSPQTGRYYAAVVRRTDRPNGKFELTFPGNIDPNGYGSPLDATAAVLQAMPAGVTMTYPAHEIFSRMFTAQRVICPNTIGSRP